jgi:DNA processing protein
MSDRARSEAVYHARLIREKESGVSTGPASNKRLRELFRTYGSLEEIYNAKFPPLFSDDGELHSDLEKLADSMPDFDIITIRDDRFPLKLRDVPYATPVLYARGDLHLLDSKMLAVIGTRKQELLDEAKDAVHWMKKLADGRPILSGLAEGSDTFAHKTAIANRYHTVAVIGTPLNAYYPSPKDNHDLQDLIAEEHLLLSEFPLGISTKPWFFVNRDITLASLADKMLVLRAGPKSGTHHAAREALRQDKLVMALSANHAEPWVDEYSRFGNFQLLPPFEAML